MSRARSWFLAVSSLAGLTAGGLAWFTAATARRIEAALPPSGRFIDVDGTQIHYTDEGSGAPIVMIHGLGGQTRNFSFGVVEPLADTYRVIVIDRPGSGYSLRPSAMSASLSAQASTVAAFIRLLRLERPLLVGHSLGGAVALAVALNHPDCAGGLALIAPLTNPQDEPPEPFRGLAIRSAWLRRLVAWTVATPASIINRDRVMDFLFGPDPVPVDFGSKGGGLLSLRPSSFYAASTDLVAAGRDLPDMTARYSSLAIPVGVLYGTGDRILDHVANGTSLVGRIPDLDLELIDAGGHMTPITAPERVVAFIRRIAARVGTPGET